MAKLVRHENGRWYVHYADRTGRSRTLSTRTTDEQLARERLAEFKAALEAPPPPEERTVNAILDHYLDDRYGQVAAHASLKYAASRVRERLGDHKPRFLSRQTIREYTKDRRSDGVKDGTIIKELRTLRSALNLADRDDWIERAPHIEIPAAPAPMERWLTREEAEKLLEAAVMPHIRLFILIALHTGARKGAILGLKWGRVFEDCTVLDFRLPGRPTSPKRRVAVPASSRLQAALLLAKGRAKTKFVIEYNGRGLKTVQTAWRETLVASGIDHCRIHDLRHTHATWLVQAGVKLSKVARMIGDTEEMVEKVYGHHSPHFLSEAKLALDDAKTEELR